jgi:uncharacterized protein (TIGR02646 family)
MLPEPDDFDQKVRARGRKFLEKIPNPTNKEWQGKEFWRDVLTDLATGHNNICSYCAQWISHPTGQPTIDHYIPKSVAPFSAYEWSNFRLCCSQLNTWKSNFQDVVDPFVIALNSFQLDFDTLMIKPNPELTQAAQEQINATLRRLRLNTDEAFIASRQSWIEDFRQGEMSFQHFKKRMPFIAYEMLRQGLVQNGLYDV